MKPASVLLKQLEEYEEIIGCVIESKDWDELNEILVKRQGLLEEICVLPLSSNERDAVVKIMIAMQITDRQFIDVVQVHKEILQKQAASLAHDRKAVQAYQIE